jgi:hypothetical protein
MTKVEPTTPAWRRINQRAFLHRSGLVGAAVWYPAMVAAAESAPAVEGDRAADVLSEVMFEVDGNQPE